jgi:alkanesulfonate monooxygenase SsuD/methylene tetrahydromethanopterin reductase-like flavin-dependent oxidoreductase (luciferase family)
MADLRIGLVTGEPLRPDSLADLSVAAAAGQIDHVGTIDHVSFQGGEGIDGLVTASAMAALLPDVSVHLGVYLLPLRHPVTVARQLSTLAQLAPGRIVFGVGLGGEDRHELEICGVDPRTRGRRMDASLGILRELLAGQTVSADDEFFSIRDARILPTPSPAIPIIVGGRSDAALRRAGRFGDGWIGVFCSPRRFAEALERVEEAAGEARRKTPGWQHTMELWCCFDRTREAARARIAGTMERFYRLPFSSFERYCAYGRPSDVAEALAPYVEAGCNILSLIPAGQDLSEAAAGVAEVKQLLGAAPTTRRTSRTRWS